MLLSYKLRFRSSFLPSRDCHERVNKQLFKWLFFGVRLLMVHVVQSALESRRGFVEACDSITSLRHLRLSCLKEGRNSWIPSCQQTRTWPLWLYLHWDSPLKSSNFNRKTKQRVFFGYTNIWTDIKYEFQFSIAWFTSPTAPAFFMPYHVVCLHFSCSLSRRRQRIKMWNSFER